MSLSSCLLLVFRSSSEFCLASHPGSRSSKTDLQTSLNEGGRGSTTTHHRAQSSLVIVQMALALVLLIGAGLLFRTIRRLWEVNPGFDTRDVHHFQGWAFAFGDQDGPGLTNRLPAIDRAPPPNSRCTGGGRHSDGSARPGIQHRPLLGRLAGTDIHNGGSASALLLRPVRIISGRWR